MTLRQTLLLAALTAGISGLLNGCEKAPPHVAIPTGKVTSTPFNPAIPLTPAQKKHLTVETAGASSSTDNLTLPGHVTFRPQAQSAVGTSVSGRVVAIFAQAGQVVHKGMPLLSIESADAAATRAALDQAATRLGAAESIHKRQVEMIEKGVGLEFERQEAMARLKDAKAEYARAQNAAELVGPGHGSLITVKAPAEGVVMQIHAEVGAMVEPGGESLIDLGDPTQLQVVVDVPESDLHHILAGQQATVELPALNTRLAAKVETFNPQVDSDSRRAKVYLSLPKLLNDLRAGMMAQVSLAIRGEEGLTVPVTAVLIKDGKRRIVYCERPDGSFAAKEVITGRSRGDRVTVLRGLNNGDRIVTKGALLLDNQAEQLL